jgi:hypothetical protein
MGDAPCMTAQGIKSYRDNAAAPEHYQKIAAGIKEPLRGELLKMLRVHQTGEASTRSQKAAGCDMRTAILVVKALTEEMR